jgi:F420-0:gamma-glutamyl ligase
MGEGSEQTPIALLEDLPFVGFQDRNPTKRELDGMRIKREDDLYWPLLSKVKWRKGGRS